MNNFIFHGVGQGLFYTGSIANGNFNFVYDCGSMGVGKIESEVKEYLSGFEKEIDFIVISHLHKDHINGLKTLLKERRVKKIYLPYFNASKYRDAFVCYLIVNKIEPSSIEFRILTRLYNCETNLIENNHNNEIDEYLYDLKVEQIDKYDEVIGYNFGWVFNLFNSKISDFELDLIQMKIKKLLDGKSLEEYIRDIDGDYTELKKIYKNLNQSSLLLLHWKRNEPFNKTLLTGDVKFDDELNEIIKEAVDKTNNLYLQIPHHGAYNEWDSINENIIHVSTKEIISFGLTNQYHHPSIKKMMEYYSKNTLHKIRFVYENKEYRYKM